MRMDDSRKRALEYLVDEMGEDAAGRDERDPVLEARFRDLKSELQGQVRRRAATESLARTREFAERLREGLRGERLKEALDRLRGTLDLSQSEVAVCFRSLQERREEDVEGMLEDLLLLEELSARSEDDDDA
jgi:hypothetical protein